jgi:D-tyrosyl-tRNA(Tyr) deacylase
MRIVIQRVSEASVTVDGKITGQIEKGLAVLVGVSKGDTHKDADFLAGKVADVRIFNDADGKMNLGLLDVGGSVLVVSQFTLYGEIRKGRRPSVDQAAPPAEARALYEYFVDAVRLRVPRVETGVFQASMQVRLVNDGPVTILCESGDR